MYFGLFRTTISMISVSPTLHSKILGSKKLTVFSLPGKVAIHVLAIWSSLHYNKYIIGVKLAAFETDYLNY